MKNKLILFTITFICYSLITQAQITVNAPVIGGVSSFASNISIDQNSPEIKGSPYYNDDFMFGNVSMYNDASYNGMFRYNLYSQEMEFIYINDTLIVDNPIKVKYISYAAKKFTYSIIVQNEWRKNLIYGSYFEVLNSGSCQLLVKYEMDFRRNRYVAHYGGGGGDGSYRYIPSEYLYMRLMVDEPAFKFKRRKRFILKTFKNQGEEISLFMKNNNINLSKRVDIIKLFDYINTL